MYREKTATNTPEESIALVEKARQGLAPAKCAEGLMQEDFDDGLDAFAVRPALDRRHQNLHEFPHIRRVLGAGSRNGFLKYALPIRRNPPLSQVDHRPYNHIPL